jgi:hypothetical protein
MNLPPVLRAESVVDESRARLRINLAQGEFEVEGSEAFVTRYLERIDALFARLENGAPPAAAVPALAPPGQDAESHGHRFAALLAALPRSATDVDRILLAGYHIQSRSPDKSFGTGEANALLVEQGIKVGNPSQCVKQNLIARRVFRHQRRYRIAQTGVDHLRQLLGSALPA